MSWEGKKDVLKQIVSGDLQSLGLVNRVGGEDEFSPYNAITFPRDLRFMDNDKRWYVACDWSRGVFDMKLPRNRAINWPDLGQRVVLKRKMSARRYINFECSMTGITVLKRDVTAGIKGSHTVARVNLYLLGYEFTTM